MTPGMLLKAFGPFVIKNEETGEVEAVIGHIGVVDRDRDVFLAGSTRPNKVKLSYYAHDVVLRNEPPVGMGSLVERGEDIVLEGKFFLNTARGREAFETVKALGADGEWSMGFPDATVLKGELTPEWKAMGARRVIAGYHPLEASPVFRGAQPHTRTVSVKAAPSLTDRIDAVNNALWKRNDAATEKDVEAERWWAQEIFDDYVIAHTTGSKLLKIAYTLAEDGTVSFGEVVEVEVEYRVVEKTALPEVVVAATPAADDTALKAAAVEEFQRFQRTLRRGTA